MEMTIKNAKVVFKYRNDGTTARGETYDPDDMTEILSIMQTNEITKLISIPIYIERELMKLKEDDRNLKGYMPIGYITNININKEEISTVIFSTFIDRVEALHDPVVTFRVILDGRNNYLKQIIGMDITPIKNVDATETTAE